MSTKNSVYLEPLEADDSCFKPETILIHNEAVSLANLVTELQDWLTSQGIYRCIIKIDERSYQLDMLFGLSAPPENTSHLPALDCHFAHKLKPFLKIH
jgi:hypothetical protein